MAEQDNDHLARLLGQMAAGDHHDDEEPAHEEHDAVDLGQAAAPPAPAPSGRPAAPGVPRASTPPAKPLARPQPAAPAAAPAPTPRRAAAPRAPLPSAQLVTPQPPAPAPPSAPEPVAAPPAADEADAPAAADDAAEAAAAEADPQQHEQEVAAEAEALSHLAAGEVEGDDDAVIVPPPPVEALAHTQPVKPIRPPVRPPGVSLFVKRTMIPPLLTLGVVCLGLVTLGVATSGGDSPYQVFAQLWFAIPIVLIGLLMLAGGLFTMMQVSNDPQYKAERAAAAAARAGEGGAAPPAAPAGRP